MEMDNVGLAFGLTILAGLSTGIGSAMAFYTKQTNKKFLSVALGFSAGVMIYVSMIEIFVKARESLESLYGPAQGYLLATASFFAGIALIALIDKFVPSFENPHELRDVEDVDSQVCRRNLLEAARAERRSETNKRVDNPALLRMGMLSALAIAIHNFPEGLAIFASAVQNPSLGVSIAVAVAIHNIPEGIAVSVPIYFATGSRKKAFVYSFLSGLSEPVGALVGYFLLRSFFSEAMFGLIFGGVAGIMVFISLDQLLPTAQKYGEHHLSIYGMVARMAVMAASLLLFA